jgi:hypothetical protein
MIIPDGHHQPARLREDHLAAVRSVIRLTRAHAGAAMLFPTRLRRYLPRSQKVARAFSAPE